MDKVSNTIPATVDEAVDQIVNHLPFRERVVIAHIDKSRKAILEQLYFLYIKNKIDEWSENTELIKSCLELSRRKTSTNLIVEEIILKELIRRLQETHKLRVVI